MKTIAVFFMSIAISLSVYGDRYTGGVVDVMAQYSKGVPIESVINNYRLAGISAVLMYPGPGVNDFNKLVTKSDGLVVALDSAKTFSNIDKQFLEITSIDGAVGLGEIIVQHHPMKGDFGFGPYEFEGFSTRLKTHPALLEGLKRGYPVFLHLEVREYPDQYEQILEDLEWLLSNHRETPVILASLGQVGGRELQRLFGEYPNLFVTTGFTTGITKQGQAKFKARGGVVSQNWINMHRKGSWRPEWKGLIEEFPDRFMLSFYNVFRPHYEFRMHKLNDFLMQNLGELDPKTAKMFACDNARVLFELNVSCD